MFSLTETPQKGAHRPENIKQKAARTEFYKFNKQAKVISKVKVLINPLWES